MGEIFTFVLENKSRLIILIISLCLNVNTEKELISLNKCLLITIKFIYINCAPKSTLNKKIY